MNILQIACKLEFKRAIHILCFCLLANFPLLVNAQSLAVSPTSLNVEACEDSIPISITLISPSSVLYSKVSIPLPDELDYMMQTASISGSAVIDSIRQDDSLHFYLSGVSNNTVSFFMKATCESIHSSNYNFDLEVYSTHFLTSGGVAINNVTSFFTINSPFLVIEPRTYANNPIVGDTIIRELIIRNTGSIPFTGSFRFDYASQLYARIIGTTVSATNGLQVSNKTDGVSYGFSEGKLTNFLVSDSLIFTDTLILESCDIDSTQTNYIFNYGCEEVDLCQSLGIEPFLYNDILDLKPIITAFDVNLDQECVFDKDTVTRKVGFTNSGTNIAFDLKLEINNLFKFLYTYDQYFYIPDNQFSIKYNGLNIAADSIRYNTIDCSSNNVINYLSAIINEFKPGDTLLVEYKTLACCGNVTEDFQHYTVRLTSDRKCLDDQKFVLQDIGHFKTYSLNQFFENLNPTIQVEPGDLDRTSDPVPFDIENVEAVFIDNVAERDSITRGLDGYFYELLGADSNAVIEVKLTLDTGLKYVDSTIFMQTLPSAPFAYTWKPYEVERLLGPNSLNGLGGMGDTIIARFALEDFLYAKNIGNKVWRYDSLEIFFSSSKIHFELQGVCPANEPWSFIDQEVRLIPDITCIEACSILLSTVDSRVSVMCPGCLTPGYITEEFRLERRTRGLKDDDNNYFTDNALIAEKATDSLINKKRAIVGDTLDLYLSAYLWNGALTVDDLGFPMKNTFVGFLLANQLEIIDSLKIVFTDVSAGRTDTVIIPNNYLITFNGSPGVDLHIDSLKAAGFANTQNLNYYNANDQIEVFASVLVAENATAEPLTIAESFSRVIGSGVVRNNMTCPAVDCYEDTLSVTEKSKMQYFCEFLGSSMTLVRVSALADPYISGGKNFFKNGFKSIYGNVVSSERIIEFMYSDYLAGVKLGGESDDSFPFEIRNQVKYDSVIIEKPNGYVLESYMLSNKSSLNDGSANTYQFLTEDIMNPPLDVTRNSYIIFPEDRIKDTTALPDFTDLFKREIVRDSIIYRTDEEEFPKTIFKLKPVNCAAVIGKRVPFSFKGIVKNYPLQNAPVVFEYNDLEAYLPEVKLTTQKISSDTIYLTDTISSSFFRLKNDPINNPLTDSSNVNSGRYLMDEFTSVFARVIASPSINVRVIKSTDGPSPYYDLEYDMQLDLYKIGSVLRGRPDQDFEIRYSYSCPLGVQNVVDSIVLITGWNCNGYPSDLATACQLDTNVYYVVPQAVGLDGVLARLDSNDISCDTVSYSLALNSQGPGKMLDIKVALNLNNSSYTYLNGSGVLDFQGGTYPINLVNGYFNLNDILYFQQNGFNYNDGTASISFDLIGSHSGGGESLLLNIDGISYCGDSIVFARQADIGPCVDESIYFITTWQVGVIDPTDKTVTIPTKGGGYDYTIDWGDGSINNNVAGDISHNYGVAGNYTIKISGDFPRIYFAKLPQNDRDKIVSIDQWGEIEWENFTYAFKDCKNVNELATDAPDLSSVTTLSLMFSGATSMNGDLSNWDLSNVTSIYGMFYGATSYNNGGQPLTWGVSTSNITNMARVFVSCSNFNQSLNDWDVSSVTNMSLMFSGASKYNQSLDSWSGAVASVTNMSHMFYKAYLFNQDIGGWDVSAVTTMDYMFSGAEEFNQYLSGWNVANVTSMRGTFLGAYKFNNGESAGMSNNPLDWEVDGVVNMQGLFGYAYVFNQDIGNWQVGEVKNMASMFNKALEFNQNIEDWDVSSVERMDYMFFHAFDFDYSLGNWEIRNVTNMNFIFQTNAMSVDNYDATLEGWYNYVSNLSGNEPVIVSTNKVISSYPLTYCQADGERQSLIDDFGWVISGDNNCSPRFKSPTSLNNEESISIRVNSSNAQQQIVTDLKYEDSDRYKVSLLNMNGQIVLEEELNNVQVQLNVNELSRGIYILRIQNNSTFETHKIILE